MAAEGTQKEVKHSERMKFGLLEAVAKEPAIWDKFDDSFRDKDDRNAAWARVTESSGYDGKLLAGINNLNV